MSKKAKTSSQKLEIGDFQPVNEAQLSQSNNRIRTEMRVTVREFQSKQKVSFEKATQIVLNA